MEQTATKYYIIIGFVIILAWGRRLWNLKTKKRKYLFPVLSVLLHKIIMNGINAWQITHVTRTEKLDFRSEAPWILLKSVLFPIKQSVSPDLVVRAQTSSCLSFLSLLPYICVHSLLLLVCERHHAKKRHYKNVTITFHPQLRNEDLFNANANFSKQTSSLAEDLVIKGNMKSKDFFSYNSFKSLRIYFLHLISMHLN